ncbi:dephospho-CoA kinase [Leptolyngbyaceae cyanobacterium UHCC 1019]
MTTNLADQTSSSLRIIGLTGGIAMGKTLVSEYLSTQYKLPILDADIYAREAVLPDSSGLQSIVDRYGSGVLLPDRTLNRQRLGEIIFSSPAERLWVEQCIHPYVRDRFVQAISHPPLNDPQHYPIVVMVVPLLFEARMTDLVTETWVVICSEDQQIERLMNRDRLTLDQAHARINSQMEITKKKVHATVILDNSSTPEALYHQVDRHIAQQTHAGGQN